MKGESPVRPTSPFSFHAADGVVAGTLLGVAEGREVDVDALAARVLALPPREAGETPYRGVVARVAARGEPPALPRYVASPEQAARELRRGLERTLDRLLEGTHRVAVLTGGGVDSSALLALVLARAREKGGSAFGVALDFGGPGDDRPFRESLAAHLGCEIVCVRPEEAAHRAEALRGGVDAVPLTWPGGPMEIELLARARAHGAEVALMGVGADELLDGDPRALADVARAGALPRALRLGGSLTGFGSPRPVDWVLRPLLASAVPRFLRRWRAHRAPLRSPDWARPRLRRVLEEHVSSEISATLSPPRDATERFTRFDASKHHLHLLWLRHQEQVASGLARRDPFLDPELARFVTSLPPAWLLHGGTRRGLFREAMRGVLPEDVRMRESKASFEPAFDAYLAASGGLPSLAPLADMRELAALDLVEPRAFREAFEAFARDPSGGWEDVWPGLAVEAFVRHRGTS